jgi:hypothetical protein
MQFGAVLAEKLLPFVTFSVTENPPFSGKTTVE